jgi:hypothetical protein
MNTTATDAALEELEQILEIEEAGYRLVSARHRQTYISGIAPDPVLWHGAGDNLPHQPSKAKALLSRRRQPLAAGFTAHQLWECESILLFNPQDLEQARLAIRLVGARPRRMLSPERLQKLLAAGQRSRYSRETTAQDARTAV